MSYIRSGHVMEYVDGTSHDYVYVDGEDIVDYGGITNEGLMEVLCRYFKGDYNTENDPRLEEYIIQQLAAKLQVKMRKKPLEPKEAVKQTIEGFDKEKDTLLKEFGLEDGDIE